MITLSIVEKECHIGSELVHQDFSEDAQCFLRAHVSDLAVGLCGYDTVTGVAFLDLFLDDASYDICVLFLCFGVFNAFFKAYFFLGKSTEQITHLQTSLLAYRHATDFAIILFCFQPRLSHLRERNDGKRIETKGTLRRASLS